MTNEFLFEAMSEIDFELLDRADQPVPLRKKPKVRLMFMAAAVALVLVLGTAGAGVKSVSSTVRYVEQNYPEYDGTVLHFAQIMLTEDENVISSLLTDDTKHKLGGFMEALRRNSGDEREETQGKEQTEPPEQQTEPPEVETTDDWQDTESEIIDREPEGGWSKGLAYTEQTQNGQTVYVVSGIGTCKDKNVYIPPEYNGYPVAAIDDLAFQFAQIEFVSVPSTIKEIGEYAFFNSSLKRAELSEGVEVIGDSAFGNAYYLEEINFPGTLKTIGPYAFCTTDLTQVILPDSVTEVFADAFTSCTRLTTIKLSANMTEIKPRMLACVRNLTSIELPKGVKSIGEWAFLQCDNLETVTMYNSIEKIDDNAFAYCDNLKEICFVGTQEEWENIEMSAQMRKQLTPLVVYVTE